MAVAERELNVHVGVTLDQWIADNDGLIKSIVYQYIQKFWKAILPYDFDDLYQVAVMSVVQSYDKFKKMNDNVDFNKFVIQYIHFKVERFISFKSRAVHVPLLKRDKVSNKVLSLNHKKMDHSRENVIEFGEMALRPCSQDETEIYVKEFINTLSEKQKIYIRMKMNKNTSSEIAEVLGYSRQNMSNIKQHVKNAWVRWSGDPDLEVKRKKLSEDVLLWADIAVERGMSRANYFKRVGKGIDPEEAATAPLRRVLNKA